MSLRLAIFDLDGTLVDSRHNIARAVDEAAVAVGLPLPAREAIPRVIGLSLDEALARLFPMATAEALVSLDQVYRASWVRDRVTEDYQEPLFDGAHDALACLQAAGFVLAIATGKGRRGVDDILARHGLVGRFVSIQTPDTAPGKPHPAMVQRAMAEAGALPDGTAMIGDTTFDMEMARAAGVTAIGVSWGNHAPEELAAAGAHRLIDSFSDLYPALDHLISLAVVGVAQ